MHAALGAHERTLTITNLDGRFPIPFSMHRYHAQTVLFYLHPESQFTRVDSHAMRNGEKDDTKKNTRNERNAAFLLSFALGDARWNALTWGCIHHGAIKQTQVYTIICKHETF